MGATEAVQATHTSSFTMKTLRLFLFVTAILPRGSHASGAAACKCIPTDSCWPSVAAWQSLNVSMSGQLIAVQPIAISCYPGLLFNNDTCTTVNSQWKKCAWQADQPAGQCQDTGDLTCPPIVPSAGAGNNCTIGNNAVYAVNATSPEHVAAGIKFAAKHNIRLAVKTTGHDFLRWNQGFGSLEIWMRHYRTGIDFQGTYKSSCGCTNSNWTGSAIRIGGGYQWSDVFAVAKANNVIVVGGGAPSIGAIGGWLQGGGYGLAAQQHGIGADQLLEAEVALADGSVIIANACQNIDIYTAIRGGGPSTYGVVLSAIFKAHPMATAAHQRLSFAYSPSNRSTFLDAIALVYSSAPDLLDAGFTMSGFWSQANSSLVGSAPSGYFHNAYAMNKTVTEGQAEFAPLLEKLSALGINVTQSWASYGDFWTLFENVSGGDDPGFPVGAIASRFFDQKALQNSTSLRTMLDVLAGAPYDITLHGSMCMSGGQIWKNANDPYTAVLPAWRTSYCLQLSQRSWPSGADDSVISAIKHEVSTVKAAAMKAFAPDTGTYMNEADRNDPDYKTNFYGSNYRRLLGIKKARDPKSVFYCPTCVGSDQWAEDEAGRLCRV